MHVWNVLHAARWKYRTKITQKIAICAPSHVCWAVSSQVRHVASIGKNLLNGNISSTCSHNMVNFGQLEAEIVSGVLGHPSYFQRLPRLGSVTARQSSSERQPNFAALNRGRHQCSALAHISSLFFLLFSSPNLSGRVGDWMFTILWHMVWP